MMKKKDSKPVLFRLKSDNMRIGRDEQMSLIHDKGVLIIGRIAQGSARGKSLPTHLRQPAARSAQRSASVGALSSRDGKQQWNLTAPKQSRRGPQDILRDKTGLTKMGHVDTIRKSFQLFVSGKMISKLVEYTNKEANRVCNESQLEWTPVDDVEMAALIGLLILAGVYGASLESLKEMWSVKSGRPVFKATMSRNRFESILRFMRFDDKSTRAERAKNDKLAPIREIWQMFNESLRKPYKPSSDITVDEQLVGFRGRCPFLVYMPKKPCKYGMKVWWAADAYTSYPLNGQVYLGRQPGQPREVGQGRRVVHDLVSPWYNTGRNVSADNLFTSVELAEELLKKRLTYVGTVRKNKAAIPAEMLVTKGKEVLSSTHVFSGQMTLVSYIPKKNKSVVVLSTQHHDAKVEGSKKKPEIISYYNSTKSGVDNLDHLIAMNTCKRKSNRWPNVMFYNIIDVATVAGMVIWLSNFPDWEKKSCGRKRRKYLVELGESLIQDQIERRLESDKIATCTEEALVTLGYLDPFQKVQPQPLQKGRCHLCPRITDRKVKQSCKMCGLHVCTEHSEVCCIKCSQ